MNLTVTAYEALLRANPDIDGPALAKPPRGHAPSEHEEQAAVIAWVYANEARWPELRLLYAVPNGGKRDPATARLLAAEGVRAGVPDLCLPVQRVGPDGAHYGAIFVELKRRDHSNGPSADQAAYIGALRRAGQMVVVAYGAQEAIGALLHYLGLER